MQYNRVKNRFLDFSLSRCVINIGMVLGVRAERFVQLLHVQTTSILGVRDAITI